MTSTVIVPGPMSLLIVFAIVAMLGGFAYITISQFQSHADAKMVCEQIIDKNDTQITSVRNGNYINDVTLYHGYDVCKLRNGTVVSNTSLGYGTELEIILKGL